MSAPTPTFTEFIGAIKVVEAFLRGRLEALKTTYPESAVFFDALLERLNGSQRTLETLAAVYTELKAFANGNGPVTTDPVDHA